MNLERFLESHNKDYNRALQEIKNGYKETHWMWYIFPQIHGLGMSSTAQYYELKSISEAKEYLENNTLKAHLIEICEELLSLDNDIIDILGYPDNLKLKSSMTLFNYIDPSTLVFKKVLDKYYNGEEDELTLNILKEEKKLRLIID